MNTEAAMSLISQRIQRVHESVSQELWMEAKYIFPKSLVITGTSHLSCFPNEKAM